ncbi:hypothetical protein F8388_015970 [Cannabis sativa]|uniref:Uncharacterized protein n=1 Tax=Cannabis sativa TaxID=3483 RepID=A0A7J6F023_CANSA|nr:hypothetical protein F8388_015970 [Cannabis sativa]KAF4363250.1 hypothetical protein G4B88_016004 [Cannabis sativa]
MLIVEDGTQSGKAKRHTRFHFEEAWCEEDECKAIVEGHWKSGEPCAIAGSFHGKTHRVGKILHGWNKKRKKELNGRITKDKKKTSTEILQDSPPILGTTSLVSDLREAHIESIIKIKILQTVAGILGHID